MGGGRRQEGEPSVGEAGRRLKERACGLCGQQQLERDAVLAIGRRASAFIQSCGQSFEKEKKEKKKHTRRLCFLCNAPEKTNDTAGVLSGEAGEGKYINTSAR